jgi:hypothetical protein
MEYNFDIEKIKDQVEDVIEYSQSLAFIDLNVEPIITKWLEAKKDFIEKMGGNLIYQSDEKVSFELDTSSKISRLRKFAELVEYHYRNEPLCQFLYSIDVNDFYNNKTSKEYECYFPEGSKTIPKEFKVIKSFKYFESNPKVLEDLQNEASRIIQENVVSGYLCFSVHPLDFLSASENVHNWRSCHALDGEYRSGNLNYLMDSSTVICYLKADNEVKLPRFPQTVPWNSKKWRTWIFFSSDRTMIFAGRQYPFTNNTGINYIKDTILPKLGFGFWTSFYKDKISKMEDKDTQRTFFFEDRFLPVGGTLKPLRSIVIEGSNTHMYNDILESSCYDPLYAYGKGTRREDSLLIWNETGFTTNRTFFSIGKECPCPICGEGSIDYAEIMACFSCAGKYRLSEEEDNYWTCEICGNSVPEEDIHYLTLSDQYVCSDCYENETSVCQRCATRDVPEIIQVFHGIPLCPDCRKIEEERPKNIVFYLDSLTAQEIPSDEIKEEKDERTNCER